MKKVRADQLLVERGLAPNRSQAARLILAGRIRIAGKGAVKAGMGVDPAAAVEISEGARFVGRGGQKLEGALDSLGVDPKDLVCLDAGASTGGFTDCLLQRGARKVYAIDVGFGQFHSRLRDDPRVALLERTNVRYLKALPEKIDLAVLDLSFISLTKVLNPIKGLLRAGGRVVALVKPQFELSPREVKKGVVRDDLLRSKAVQKVKEFVQAIGFSVEGESPSVLPGPKGNREVFIHLVRVE